jgi:hypothetical protein
METSLQHCTKSQRIRVDLLRITFQQNVWSIKRINLTSVCLNKFVASSQSKTCILS